MLPPLPKHSFLHSRRSTSAAYNVEVDFMMDPLLLGPFNLATFPGSIVVGSTPFYANPTTPRFTVSIPTLQLSAKVLSISFMITAATLVQPFQTMAANASLRYDSIPYLNVDGRLSTEFETPSYNTRNWTITAPTPNVTLTLLETSQVYTADPNITIFETATFVLHASFPEGLVKNLNLVSLIPNFFNYTTDSAVNMVVTTSSPGYILCDTDDQGNNGQPCEQVAVSKLLALQSNLVNTDPINLKEIAMLMGNVLNLNRDNSYPDWIELQFTLTLGITPRLTKIGRAHV